MFTGSLSVGRSVAVRYSGPDMAEYEPRVKRYRYSTIIHYKCGYAMKHWKERVVFHCGEKIARATGWERAAVKTVEVKLISKRRYKENSFIMIIFLQS